MAIPHHDWYLKEWLLALGKKQSFLIEETGLRKATISELASGKQRYNRDILNLIAKALNLRPFELLMHPADAMAMRRVREDAARIATNLPPPEELGTGTGG